MSVYACVVATIVQGALFSPLPGQSIGQAFPPDMTCWTDVSAVSPLPSQGWTCSGSPLACAAPVAPVVAAPVTFAPPVTGLKIVGGHLVGTTGDTAAAAVLDPGAVPLTGDVTGTNTAAVAARSRPAWTTLSVASGTPAQVLSGYSIVDLMGTGLLAAGTVRLPASPQDRDTVRLVAMGALSITLLTVQDAGGNTVQAAFSLGQSTTALYQYQASAWVRIGN